MGVALAANAHAHLHPRSPINSVFVEELEPLPSSALERVPEGGATKMHRLRVTQARRVRGPRTGHVAGLFLRSFTKSNRRCGWPCRRSRVRVPSSVSKSPARRGFRFLGSHQGGVLQAKLQADGFGTLHSLHWLTLR